MKKNLPGNLKLAFLTALLLLLAKSIDVLPWWSFVIPVLMLGVFISLKKWKVNSFTVGFATGFFIWLGAHLYFNFIFQSDVADKVALLLSIPGIFIPLIAGLTGGLLTGLALYTGKNIFTYTDQKA